jgi:hypothetical protein
MNSTFKTIGRIVIILAVAALVIAGLSLLTSSTGSAPAMQQPAFEANMARPERGGEGGSAIGLLELVKNTLVMALIITTYWFGQKWIEQSKRTSRVTA